VVPGPTVRLARLTYPYTVALIPFRGELPALLNRRHLVGCGAEVGVARGEFSESILGNWRGMHLISIDPWLQVAPEQYVDRYNMPQGEQDRLHDETRERLARYGDRSSVWRLTSVEASRRVPHHSLDFVYIDARHDYDSVREDLACWFDKVRPGGVIAGHDYMDARLERGVYGVKSAVDEFFGEKGLPVSTTFRDGDSESWIVEVPLPGAQSRRTAWRLASAVRALMVAALATRSRLRSPRAT
jgi:hypothetical protein